MLWLKAFHIISMVCWFAGIFYLPRLFVYHASSGDQISKNRFKIMEKKLYHGIMTPSALMTVLLGIILVSMNWPYYKQAVWLHIKITLVVILLGYHHWCGHIIKAFAKDINKHNSTFYRWFNEFPVLLLLAITILAVVKPL